MKKLLHLTLIVPFLLSLIASAQIKTGDVSTRGACSPVVINPQGGFTLTCKDTSLSSAESKRLADQISELLGLLKASSSNSEDLTRKLDQVIQSVNDVKSAVVLRHLTEDQKTALLVALAPFKGKNIYVFGNSSDSEAMRYAQEFFDLFKAAGVNNSLVVAGAVGGVQPIGLALSVALSVHTQNDLPPQCIALINVLHSNFGIALPIMSDPIKMTPDGACYLIVGSRP